MLYLLALVFPWLAVLFCGKPIEAVLNFVAWVTIIGTIPAIIHGMAVVSSHQADQRSDRQIAAVRKETRRQTKELTQAAAQQVERQEAQEYALSLPPPPQTARDRRHAVEMARIAESNRQRALAR